MSTLECPQGPRRTPRVTLAKPRSTPPRASESAVVQAHRAAASECPRVPLDYGRRQGIPHGKPSNSKQYPFSSCSNHLTPEHGIACLCMPCNLPCCRRPCSHAPMRTARRCRPTKRRRRSRKRPRWPRWRRRRRRQRRKGVRNEKASELSRKRPFLAVFRSDPASQIAARSCLPGRGLLSCKPQGDTDSGRICPWSIDGAIDGPGPFDGGGRIAPSGAPSGCRGRRLAPQPCSQRAPLVCRTRRNEAAC